MSCEETVDRLLTRAGALDQMNSRVDLNRTRVLRPETTAGTLVPTRRVARLERGSRYILPPPRNSTAPVSRSPAVGVYGGRSRSRNFPMAIRNVPLKRDLCEGGGLRTSDMCTGSRRHLALVAAAALVLDLVSCHKSPTNPSPSGPVTIVALKLVVPSEMAPGETVQLIANATRSDGSVENVTSRVEWTVRSDAASPVMSVTATGLATGRERGGEVVTARFDGRADESTIVVLPKGTFRLAGTVSDNGIGLEKATVTVISGVGEGLIAPTDTRGYYALYGVAGQVEVRATRDGYFDRTQQVNVTSHGSHSLEMVASRPSTDLSGTYTLTVSAEGASGRCLPGFPEPLKRRIYTATVEQTGADLSVSLSGVDFVIARDGSGNSFRGVVAATGEARFSIRPATVWDYDGPDVVEQLSDGTKLCVAGSILARSTPTGIFGTVDRSRGATIYRCSGSYISHSGCSIERFEMRR